MNTAAFASIMLLILFGFFGAMIWAYRKNDYEQEKPKVESQQLNQLDDTLKSITSYSDQLIQEQEEQQKAQEESLSEEQQKEKTEIELQSRKAVIQSKNHIKKSAADEYFEKTKNVANEILQPKTK